jgi:hypothetical protein
MLCDISCSFKLFLDLSRTVDDLDRLDYDIRSCHRTSAFDSVYSLDIYSADIDVQIISQALLGWRAAATLIINRIIKLQDFCGIVN